MTHIASVAAALPPHRYDQSQIRAALQTMWRDQPQILRRVESLFENTQVRTRHLALPLEAYAGLTTFGQANDAWIRVGMELGEQAIGSALEQAGVEVRDVDLLLCASVTGIASPSLDARLMNRMGFRPDLRRLPVFGLGCVAGAAGLARCHDFLAGKPDGVAVLLAMELCSLTFQRGDLSLAHVISTGLFGDGAAAVVLTGEHRPVRRPTILATRSVFYPDTEEVMGWKVSEQGFNLILSAGVPDMARKHLAQDVDAFLRDQGLGRDAIQSWVCHPGGPKVLQAVEAALGVGPEATAVSWQVLSEQGNLSSASVLLALERMLYGSARPASGSLGMLLAMGPGFCSELVLLLW
jgi:alkylresorcinol/alkylpyrone synthase